MICENKMKSLHLVSHAIDDVENIKKYEKKIACSFAQFLYEKTEKEKIKKKQRKIF